MLKQIFLILVALSEFSIQRSIHLLPGTMHDSQDAKKYSFVGERGDAEKPVYVALNKNEYPVEQKSDDSSEVKMLLPNGDTDDDHVMHSAFERNYFGSLLAPGKDRVRVVSPMNRRNPDINLNSDASNMLFRKMSPGKSMNPMKEMLSPNSDREFKMVDKGHGGSLSNEDGIGGEDLKEQSLEYQTLWQDNLEKDPFLKGRWFFLPSPTRKYFRLGKKSEMAHKYSEFFDRENFIDNISTESKKAKKAKYLNSGIGGKEPRIEVPQLKPNTVKRWLSTNERRINLNKTDTESPTLPIIRGNIENEISHLRKKLSAKDDNRRMISNKGGASITKPESAKSVKNDHSLSSEEQKNLVFMSVVIAACLFLMLMLFIIPFTLNWRCRLEKQRKKVFNCSMVGGKTKGSNGYHLLPQGTYSSSPSDNILTGDSAKKTFPYSSEISGKTVEYQYTGLSKTHLNHFLNDKKPSEKNEESNSSEELSVENACSESLNKADVENVGSPMPIPCSGSLNTTGSSMMSLPTVSSESLSPAPVVATAQRENVL